MTPYKIEFLQYDFETGLIKVIIEDSNSNSTKHFHLTLGAIIEMKNCLVGEQSNPL